MDARRTALGFAAGRIGFGAAFVLAPGLAARAWGGPGTDTPAARMLARSLGGRDLMLGVGLLRAMQGEGGAGNWAVAGAVADAVDGLATLLAWRSLRPAGRAVLPFALGGAAAGMALAMQLEREPG